MVYKSNKAIHPGVTVQHTLDSLGMTQKKLAERIGLTEKHVSQIINGEASITADTALLLENALGGTASYWLNLDKNYKETKARLEQETKALSEVELLANFPYGDLSKLGRVDQTRSSVEKVINLWKFFGVNSLSSIKQTEAVAYRRDYGSGVKQESLAAWLRCGEIDATMLQLSDFDEPGFKALLPIIRKKTQSLHQGFFEELQTLFAGVGVGLVVVQHLAGTQANGATRWIGRNPVIQLSTRRRNADTVWFTLFHEIGHIFLHGKKDQFISFNSSIKSPDESEADAFASRALIPDDVYHSFIVSQSFSEESIKKFAADQEIDAGIVVGRLKNDKWVSYNALHHLHGKLEVKR